MYSGKAFWTHFRCCTGQWWKIWQLCASMQGIMVWKTKFTYTSKFREVLCNKVSITIWFAISVGWTRFSDTDKVLSSLNLVPLDFTLIIRHILVEENQLCTFCVFQGQQWGQIKYQNQVWVQYIGQPKVKGWTKFQLPPRDQNSVFNLVPSGSAVSSQ